MRNQLTGEDIADSELSSLVDLARNQYRLERQIEKLESQLGEAKEKHRQVSQQLIPDKMMELGLDSIKLSDGTKVAVSKFYSASITPERMAAAHAWLRENGHGDLIKNTINCVLARGQDDRADKILKALTKLGVAYERKSAVHPMTLKAFVREMIEGGSTLPLDLLGVHVGNITKLEPPKE